MSIDLLKNRWLAYVAIIVFIIAKLPHLHYAFYWDESWVYAPAIHLMYAHGPSLLPSAVPIDFSRGHPLLYQAACAAWMHVFGNSNFSMHCFALSVSVMLAIALYEVMLALFNQRTALISLALLLLNTIFFAESSFVLTDISIALLTFLSLYAYVKERYVLTTIFLTMLFYTKESGLMAAGVLGIDILFCFLTKKINLRKAIYRSLTIFVSLALIVVFFVIQKHTLGWYVNPDHTGIINMSLENTFSNITLNGVFLFSKEHAYTFLIPLAALLLLAAWKQKKLQYIVYLAGAAIVYLGVFVFGPKDFVYYVFVLILLVSLYSFLTRPLKPHNIVQQKFIKLCAAICIAYTYFNCINFFEGRYLFPVIFLLCIVLLSVFYDHIISKISSKLFPYVLIILVCIGFSNFRIIGDEMGIYERMDLQQQLVDYLVKNDLYDRYICSVPYLEKIHLTDAKTGFLRSGKVFGHVTDSIEQNTEFVIVDNIESDGSYAGLNKNEFILLRRFEKGISWVDVYKRK